MALIPVTFKHSTETGKEKSGKVSTITARMLYANTFSGKVGIVKGYKKDDATDELSVSYDSSASTSTQFRLVFNKGAVSIYGGVGIVEQGTIFDVPKGLTNYSLGIKIDLTQPAGNEMMFYYKPSSESLIQQDLQIRDTDGVYEFELFKITTTGSTPSVTEKTTQYIQSVNDFLEDKLKDLGFYEGSIALESRFTATTNKVARQGNFVIGSLVLNGIGVMALSTSASGKEATNTKTVGILPVEFRPKVAYSTSVLTNLEILSGGENAEGVISLIANIGTDGVVTLTLYSKISGSLGMGLQINFANNATINFGHEANQI